MTQSAYGMSKWPLSRILHVQTELLTLSCQEFMQFFQLASEGPGRTITINTNTQLDIHCLDQGHSSCVTSVAHKSFVITTYGTKPLDVEV